MDLTKNESSVAVTRMKEYIAKHVQEPITAKDLAKAAGYSQYHAARVFKGETGLSPFEYLRRERLTASAHALRSGRCKVLDIALDFVFDSHEGFSRAFTNGFGISPKKYANYPAPEGWLIPYRYLDRSNLHAEPEVNSYQYAFDSAPRMQLEPQSWRGYIEMLPVRRMSVEPLTP